MNDRLAVLSALADPHRLEAVDALADGDLAPGELGELLGLAPNLLAHHLRALEDAGIVRRRRSDADGRRAYLTLVHAPLVDAATSLRDAQYSGSAPTGSLRDTQCSSVIFLCTGGSARSQLAAALLARHRIVPAASAGTDPDPRIHPLALDELDRRGLVPAQPAPAGFDEAERAGALVVAVCDRAYESHGADLHWSVPDPAAVGTSQAFREAYDALAPRVDRLAATLTDHESRRTS